MAQPDQSKNVTVATSDSLSDLNSPCGMNRRSFLYSLRGRALDAATAGVAALPLAPVAASTVAVLGIGMQDAISDALPEQGIDLITKNLVDVTVPLEHGGSINVLGLFHTTSCYERAKAHLEPKIAEADIVLYELGKWFDSTIGDPARFRGQMAGSIEGDFTQGKGALVLIAATSYLVMKGYEQLKGGFHYAARAILGKTREALPRRTVLANTAKMFGVMYAGLPVAAVAADVSGNESLRAFDVAPLSDGRSVKMLDNAFVCAEKHPGKRIAVVVGNAHATAMRFYLRNSNTMELFEAKRSIYKGLQLNAIDFRGRDKSTPGVL